MFLDFNIHPVRLRSLYFHYSFIQRCLLQPQSIHKKHLIWFIAGQRTFPENSLERLSFLVTTTTRFFYHFQQIFPFLFKTLTYELLKKIFFKSKSIYLIPRHWLQDCADYNEYVVHEFVKVWMNMFPATQPIKLKDFPIFYSIKSLFH